MMNEDWIFSNEAKQLLVSIESQVAQGKSAIQVIRQLRKSVSPVQASQLVDLHTLRIRGQKKFAKAQEMFFKKKELEQATSETVARYKAKRFRGFDKVADLCCGIGGDSIALSSVTELEIVDVDKAILSMAEQNISAYASQCTASCLPAQEFSLNDVQAFHIDPDRRVAGKAHAALRTTLLENFSPPQVELQKLAAANANFGLKLAPATEMWEGDYEIEFIGHDRECKQQMIWSGQLAGPPGVRATVVQQDGQWESFFVADKPAATSQLATTIGSYVLDPHSCLLSAGLVDDFASKNELTSLCRQSFYLTSDQPLDSKLVSCFAVKDVLKPNLKSIEKYLDAHDIGRVEVKKRGPFHSVFEKLNRLKRRGKNSITIVLSSTPCGFRAIACQRLQVQPGE